MKKLEIRYEKTANLRRYAGNAKLHPDEQIAQIAESIKEFGMNDPIAVWKNNEIIEGHGRLMACEMLGIDEVPVIDLDGLSDEQRRAYMNVHNQLTMNTGFDLELLAEEIGKIENIDMSRFGFDLSLEEQKETDSESEKPAAIPESRVYICAVSAFGTDSETIVAQPIPQSIADKILDAMQKSEAGGVLIAQKMLEALNDI